ncbi:hypothetical protein Dimus_030476, partial [Dionaea muscipula]
EPSQQRIVEDRFDSQSPGPRHPVMFQGSPSPPTTFHRRPAPSPGPRPRRLRSPSPVLRLSVDPVEVSSSEGGEGNLIEMSGSSSEEEDDGLREEEEGMLVSSILPDLSLMSEDLSNQGGSSSSISRSSILSPAAAIRFCQEAIVVSGPDSVSSMLTSLLVADIREPSGVGDSVGADAPMVDFPCPAASLAGGGEDCSTGAAISGLKKVTGGENAQVAVVGSVDNGG